MIGRRAAVLGLAVLAAGCGFHPVYDSGARPDAAMAAVYVNIIPNRSGQLLRQALQARLEGSDDAAAKRFELSVAYGESVQTLGVQPDNSTTRNRDVGTATWSLHPAGDTTRKLAGGTVRSLDGYNIIDEQYFYADLQEEQTQHRLAEALADQIVLGIALYFRKNPTPL